MKENIIIRLERENEYHEVENLVRESSRIWRRKNFRDRFLNDEKDLLRERQKILD